MWIDEERDNEKGRRESFACPLLRSFRHLWRLYVYIIYTVYTTVTNSNASFYFLASNIAEVLQNCYCQRMEERRGTNKIMMMMMIMNIHHTFKTKVLPLISLKYITLFFD